MAKKPIPTPEQLRQLFRYDPVTGDLFWRPRGIEWFADGTQSAEHNAAIWNGKYSGKLVAHTDRTTGYIRASVMGTRLYAHRIIWAMHFGHHPSHMIDHISGDKADNRISNLREATMADNQHNRSAVATVEGRATTSIFCGVSLCRRTSRWAAEIRAYEPGRGSVRHRLGTYGCQTAAAFAYDRAARRLHGEFARTNF